MGCCVLLATMASAATALAPTVPACPKNAKYTMTVDSLNKATTTVPPPAQPTPTPYLYQPPFVPKTIEIVQYGDLRRARLDDNAGKTKEIWIIGGAAISESEPGAYRFTTFGINSPPYPYYSEGYFRSEIIKAENYVGIMALGNRKAHLFRGAIQHPGPPSALGKPSLLTEVAEYWIDPKTLEPIAFINSQIRINFSFDTPPTSAPSVPESAQQTLDQYKKELDIARRMKM